MQSAKRSFTYSPAISVTNWGCSFDSLTELKFALSIWEEYDFMRSPVSIYYHPGTLQPVRLIHTYHRRYTPDFLIRHKQTGAAFLVEIKPRGFQDQVSLQKRRSIAENFIRQKKYDWKFRVIFDDEIILTAQQLEDFEECRKLRTKSAFRGWINHYQLKLQSHHHFPLNAHPGHKQVEYLVLGRVITLHENR